MGVASKRGRRKSKHCSDTLYEVVCIHAGSELHESKKYNKSIKGTE